MPKKLRLSNSKRRSTSKRRSGAIILNDNSDGEIEFTAPNSDVIIVPIISTEKSVKDDNILSPEQLERMLNHNKNEADITKTGFDYDFMSQITQRHTPSTVSTPRTTSHSNTLKNNRKLRLSQTPPPMITTPAPIMYQKQFISSAKRSNYNPQSRRKKKKKKKKFKPPRLLVESKSKSKSQSQSKSKKRFAKTKPKASSHFAPCNDPSEKPPETAGFCTVSSRITTKSNTNNKEKPQTIRIKKGTFNKTKLRQFLGKNSSKSCAMTMNTKTAETEDIMDPYAVFMNAIPQYDDIEPLNILQSLDTNTPRPLQLDAMTNDEYTKYKEKLKLRPTRSIVSANTLRYRNIPPNEPDLCLSKSASSHAKLVNFDAILNERKRKMPFAATKGEEAIPNKKRKVAIDHETKSDIHFNIPHFDSFPTLKDLAQTTCVLQLSKKDLGNTFGIDSEIISLSLMNAADYRFNTHHNSILILNEDDALSINPYALHSHSHSTDSSHALIHDDWSDIDADRNHPFNRHIRNEIKSDANTKRNTKKGSKGKGWETAHQELLALGCDAQLLSTKWVRHHWKMIVWSLASRVRSFPFKLSVPSYFTYANVLQRLQYRYEYELNGGHLSIIARIYRGDVSAASCMTLFVSRIIKNINGINRLWLSDGWYEIEATFLDSDVESLVECGDIKLGDKVKICLARKQGANCEALESKAARVCIQIARNYVRKALWYKKLGHQALIPNLFRVSLRSIHCNGGSVPYIYCCVTRKYCNQYSIKVGDDQRGKIYTLKAKECADSKYEAKRDSKMIEIRLRIAKEMGLDTFISDAPNYDNLNRNEIRKKIELLKDRVHSEIMNEIDLNRKISLFFCCKIHEIGNDGILCPQSTEITVWNPNGTVSRCMTEGNYVKIYNINTQNRVNTESNIAQLSAGSRSKFELVHADAMGYTKAIMSQNYNKYIVSRYYDFSSFNIIKNHELDMIGCVIAQNAKGIFIVSLSGDCNEYHESPLVFLKVTQNENTVHYRSMKENAIYIIRNVKYDGYDDKLSLHSTFSYSRTQFISNPVSDLQFDRAKLFVTTQYFMKIIQQIKTKIDSLLPLHY